MIHLFQNKGITFVAHPHSGWLSVSRNALNCLKVLKQIGTVLVPKAYNTVPLLFE